MPGLATDTHHSPDSLDSRQLPFGSPALMPGKLKFRCSARRYLQVPVITPVGIVQDYRFEYRLLFSIWRHIS